MRNQLVPLTMETIREKAPSVFSSHPVGEVSDRYRFIPTIRVVKLLDMIGWKPVSVRQVISRTEDGQNYAKHEIRFRNESSINQEFLSVGDSLPEISLTNSHNRSSVFNLMVGLFRLVCSNGLMVADSTIAGIRIKHIGFNDSDIGDAVFQLTNDLPKALERITHFRLVILNLTEQRWLARSAAMLRWNMDSDIPIRTDDLLLPHRYDDNHNDLFSTFNRIQEHLIRGGIKAVNNAGKLYRTRPIKSIDMDIAINQGLWNLIEKFYDMKTAG